MKWTISVKKLKNSIQSKNRILALLVTLAGCILLSVIFDIFYDMNDDVMIKDILAGVYTGMPDGHNIQMLYPLAFCISVLYRLVPALPWFGLFLIGSIFLSFYLVLYRILNRMQTWKSKALTAVLLALLYAGLLLWEMVFVQYTVVCGILAMTAAVNLYLTPKKLSRKEFLLHNLPSILLVVIAFNLRTEMLLLMSPFLAIAGLLRWSEEEKIFCKEALIRYGTVLGGIGIGLLVSLVGNHMAYRTLEWTQFEDFFDARTTVYDFTWYPDYDRHSDFYEQNGISKAQYTLIDNYNFGLDERIDSAMLNTIAEYQKQQSASDTVLSNQIKNVLWMYRYQITHFDFSVEHETRVMPYNLLVIILYLWLAGMALACKDLSYVWKIPAMWLLRSVPWIYILWKGRVVARLTHSMYLMEIMILGTCIFLFYQKKKQTSGYLLAAILASIIMITLPGSLRAVISQQNQREAVNTANDALQEYCKEHPENYYYVDVYSTVAFSEEIFVYGDHDIQNYDILGGWFSKSPLSREKAAQFGITDTQNDLLGRNNVYFIAEEDSDLSWITEYYQELGIQVLVNRVDTILTMTDVAAAGQQDVQNLAVYQIRQ